MRLRALTLNKPNLNGHIYTTEVVEQAMSKIPSCALMVSPVMCGSPLNIEKAVGVVTNHEITNDELLVDVKILDITGDKKKYFETMLDSGIYTVRPSGIGKLDDEGNITDYELQYLAITSDPA